MLEGRWARATVIGGLGLLLTLGSMASSPVSAQDGGDLAEACEPAEAVPELGHRGCKSIEAGTWLTAGACRRIDALEEPICPSIDGRAVHPAAMAEYESSWLRRALDLQRNLDIDVPLRQTLIPHTHNSANSTAYVPSVSNLDANQVLSLTDQLRLGIRAIEIDVHWAPHPSGDAAQGARAVVQCHGEPVATPAGTLHAGCSVDTLLVDLLREVRAWLDEPTNADEVLVLYLENALDDDAAAHAAAVDAIVATLGDLVARPELDGGCQSLPVERSKRELLAEETRVLITGNCGPGGWTDWVFERGDHWDESGGSTFDCATERAVIDFDSTLVRRYEDSTWLSAMAGSGSHRDAQQVADMVSCGVDLVGFDQLHPGDDRLPALVWSWRADEPAVSATGQCAALGADGRFFASGCTAKRQVACRTASGGWAITAKPVAWRAGQDACQKAGHESAGVPFNGWDSGLLQSAARQIGVAEVWLAYHQDPSGSWVTGIPPTKPSAAPKPTIPRAPAGAASSAAHLQPVEPRGLAPSRSASTTRVPAAAAPAVGAALAVGLLVGLRRRLR